MNPWRMALAAAVGAVGAVVAAAVTIGMIRGANPQFEKGRSPVTNVLVQEALGVLTLTILAAVARHLPAVARGKPAIRPVALFAGSLVLAVAWAFALITERAS